MILESDLTVSVLANEAMELMKDPDSLKKMAQINLKLGRPHAAKAICDQALLWHQERNRKEYAS